MHFASLPRNSVALYNENWSYKLVLNKLEKPYLYAAKFHQILCSSLREVEIMHLLNEY